MMMVSGGISLTVHINDMVTNVGEKQLFQTHNPSILRYMRPQRDVDDGEPNERSIVIVVRAVQS